MLDGSIDHKAAELALGVTCLQMPQPLQSRCEELVSEHGQPATQMMALGTNPEEICVGLQIEKLGGLKVKTKDALQKGSML